MKQLFVILLLCFNINVFGQIYFKPEKREIVLGDSVKLKWSIDKFKKKSVSSIDKLLDSISSSGFVYVTPDTTSYYRLYVTTKRKTKKKPK